MLCLLLQAWQKGVIDYNLSQSAGNAAPDAMSSAAQKLPAVAVDVATQTHSYSMSSPASADPKPEDTGNACMHSAHMPSPFDFDAACIPPTITKQAGTEPILSLLTSSGQTSSLQEPCQSSLTHLPL